MKARLNNPTRNLGKRSVTATGGSKTAAKLLKKKSPVGRAGTGRGRGVIGGGTADVYGRLPSASTGSGTYGGGYAYKDGHRPGSAKRRG